MVLWPHQNLLFILMKPKTLEIIESLKAWRKETGVQAFFTLDAGPNVHILYKDCDAIKVEKWLKESFSEFYDQQKILFDEVGSGPVQL